MFIRKALSLALVCTLLLPFPLNAQSQESLDYAMIGKIRDEGLQRSQVMEHIVWLSDIYGPRLTGSPAIKQASTANILAFMVTSSSGLHYRTRQAGLVINFPDVSHRGRVFVLLGSYVVLGSAIFAPESS